MRILSLQSGSNGNCVYVEAGGTRLLIDAGIPAKLAEQRLAEHGLDAEGIDAILISHDHADHVHCAGVLHRKLRAPLYLTRRTLEAAYKRFRLGALRDVRLFHPGEPLRVGDLRVHTLRTPHDAAAGVAFVVDDGRERAGVLTDLGHPFEALRQVMPTLDAVFIESNYDPHLLATGPYPPHLQRRIRGGAGHLSNRETAGLLALGVRGGRLRWACLGHLSAKNNTPEVALRTHHEVLGDTLPLHLAWRHRSSALLEV